MDGHKKFLADRLLSEERAINYRLLSRALDIHVNTAKEMLYDFHKYQNTQRADSVHATYLIYGTKNSDVSHKDGDVEMSSSIPDESFSDEVSTATLAIVREEDLKAALEDFQDVTSIHVYSLAPHPQKDLSLLADIATQLSEYPKPDNVTATTKKYGTILNSQVRRRDRKAPPPVSGGATSKPVKQQPVPTKSTSATQAKPASSLSKPASTTTKPKEEPAEAPSEESAPSSNASKKQKPASKSGGIMQSFARAAAKPAKPKPTAKKADDDAMALSDDGEADDTDMPAPKKENTEPEALKKTRKEREEELRRMMEQDDDEDEGDEKEDSADEEMEDAPEPEPEPEPELEPDLKEEKEPAEMVSSSGNGRRRGKRRIMQKKRILDDQGYMVTIQEPGWESFSEDEAPPAKKSAKPTPTSTPSSSAPKKKAAGKAGQGNIMSFFSKK